MAEDLELTWQRCSEPGCRGVVLPRESVGRRPADPGGRCWAHASEGDVAAALERLAEDGRLDARGVTVGRGLLERLLAAARRENDGIVLVDADFRGATLARDVSFDGVTFQGPTRFDHATFEGVLRFNGTRFEGHAVFSHVAFQGAVRLDGASFQRDAILISATFYDDVAAGPETFQGNANFNFATFNGEAAFDVHFPGAADFAHATFRSHAVFVNAVFDGEATFSHAVFRRNAVFSYATFQDQVMFRGAVMRGGCWLNGSIFLRTQGLGPVLVWRSMVLDQAVFHERVVIEVSGAALCCRRARFLSGAQLRVRWAYVALDDADLAAASILQGVPVLDDLDEGRWGTAIKRLHGRSHDGTDGQPRLVSIRRADVAGLTIADVDMQACRFAGALHLDQLQLDKADLPSTPRPRRWSRWWWTRRSLAEEHQWRATRNQAGRGAVASDADEDVDRLSGWYGRDQEPPSWIDAEPVSPTQIAELYRALRKSREDQKDEPGAADFYYGEMEMRRHDSTNRLRNRLVISAYWLLSGYGLRAWRPLAWLTSVLVLSTAGLACVGLDYPDWSLPRRLGTAILVAVEGAVFRASEQDLTYAGRLIQVALRIAGPILLLQAALAIAREVKR